MLLLLQPIHIEEVDRVLQSVGLRFHFCLLFPSPYTYILGKCLIHMHHLWAHCTSLLPCVSPISHQLTQETDSWAVQGCHYLPVLSIFNKGWDWGETSEGTVGSGWVGGGWIGSGWPGSGWAGGGEWELGRCVSGVWVGEWAVGEWAMSGGWVRCGAVGTMWVESGRVKIEWVGSNCAGSEWVSGEYPFQCWRNSSQSLRLAHYQQSFPHFLPLTNTVEVLSILLIYCWLL